MRHALPLTLAAALLAAPAHAQEEPSLFEEGANLILRGLLEEVAPPLQELAGIANEYLPAFQLFAEEMGPAIAEVISQIDSIAYYEMPEIAPNGDIVIRRRADAPEWVPPLAEADPAPADRPAEPPAESPAPDIAPEDEGGGLLDLLPFDLSPPPAEGDPAPNETDL